MKNLTRLLTLSALGGAVLAIAALQATTAVLAAEYPAKPITFVVPWPAGDRNSYQRWVSPDQ